MHQSHIYLVRVNEQDEAMLHDVGSGSDSSSSSSTRFNSATTHLRQGPWTPEEHERFLVAMTLFPRGPWSDVAKYIGTRTTRQAMAHAQKTNLRRARHARGLRPPGRVPGPNSRRRQRSRRRLSLSPSSEPFADTKFVEPLSTSIDHSDTFCGSYARLPDSSSRNISTHAAADNWLDDFVWWFDLTDFDDCVV